MRENSLDARSVCALLTTTLWNCHAMFGVAMRDESLREQKWIWDQGSVRNHWAPFLKSEQKENRTQWPIEAYQVTLKTEEPFRQRIWHWNGHKISEAQGWCFGMRPIRYSIPFIVHYFWPGPIPEPYGDWSKVVHYKRNRAPFGTQIWCGLLLVTATCLLDFPSSMVSMTSSGLQTNLSVHPCGQKNKKTMMWHWAIW